MHDIVHDIAAGLILDSGPHYHEYEPGLFIKEPWNAASSVFFLVPVFYWVWKLRGRYKEHAHITFMLPFLFLNGIGSTMFHALRGYDEWLFLDFAPAALMSLFVAGYLWNKLIRKVWLTVVVLIALNALRVLFFVGIELKDDLVANVNYLITGIMFLIPIIVILVRTKGYKWHLVVLTALFLGGALLFRYLDHPRPNLIEPMGTHFLWHVTSALAVFSLGWYLFRIRHINISEPFNDQVINN